MPFVLRDLELAYVAGTGYFIRLLDPETAMPEEEPQSGPFPEDDVEDQLIALGVPIEQAAPLVLDATQNVRAVLKNHPTVNSEDANSW